jgi:hypothetical protein
MVPPNLQTVVEKDLKAAGLDKFSVMFVRPEFEMQYLRVHSLEGRVAAAEGQLLCRVHFRLEPESCSGLGFGYGLDPGKVHTAFKQLQSERHLSVRELTFSNSEINVTVDLLYGCPWSRKFLAYFLHLVGPHQPTPPVKHIL